MAVTHDIPQGASTDAQSARAAKARNGIFMFEVVIPPTITDRDIEEFLLLVDAVWADMCSLGDRPENN